MGLLLSAVLTVLISSYDRWLGSYIFFSFPVFLAYLKVLGTEEKNRNILVLVYTVFYFTNKYDLGLMALLFYILYMISDFLFYKIENNIFSVGIYMLPSLVLLCFLSNSLISFILTVVLFTLLYFINMRLIKNER